MQAVLIPCYAYHLHNLLQRHELLAGVLIKSRIPKTNFMVSCTVFNCGGELLHVGEAVKNLHVTGSALYQVLLKAELSVTAQGIHCTFWPGRSEIFRYLAQPTDQLASITASPDPLHFTRIHCWQEDVKSRISFDVDLWDDACECCPQSCGKVIIPCPSGRFHEHFFCFVNLTQNPAIPAEILAYWWSLGNKGLFLILYELQKRKIGRLELSDVVYFSCSCVLGMERKLPCKLAFNSKEMECLLIMRLGSSMFKQ